MLSSTGRRLVVVVVASGGGGKKSLNEFVQINAAHVAIVCSRTVIFDDVTIQARLFSWGIEQSVIRIYRYE
jgi:cell division GTPase FtsZ